MEEVMNRTLAFIVVHRMWAAPIIGLLAFGESLAVIGLLIPATTIMVAIGGLMGAGLIDPFPTIVCAIIGAILGDWVSFVVGKSVGPSVYHRWPLNRHRAAVARARLFFRRYGFAAVFFGRFLGPVRACVPLVAGVVQMQLRPFQIANAASAVLWAPALFAPGYFAARKLGFAEHVSINDVLALGVGLAAFSILTPLIVGAVFARRRNRD